jgi:hypothetical protein
MRRIALVMVSCAVAGFAVLAGLIASLGWALGVAIVLSSAAVVVMLYIAVVGPWQRRWGATDSEARGPMPGDDLLRPGAHSTTRAITIDAAPRDVFPWLVQIGYGRGGWYSYDWIDNDGRRSIDRVDPALQDLSAGDRIQMFPGSGPVVREIVPEHHILSGGDADTWCLLVEPTAEGRSRLVSRWRQDRPRDLGTFIWTLVCDPGAFVMERKMLRTIRDRAEAGRSTEVGWEGLRIAPRSSGAS